MTTMPATMQRITDQLADDVDAAFPAMVKTHVDGLYSGVLRLTNSRPDAEDIVQETFVRAHRALHGYAPERRRELKLAGWLWTIAINLCRNRARSTSRRPRQVSLDVAAEPTASDDPAGEAIAALDTTWAHRLAMLNEAERHAVVLRHVVGLSYTEIAIALDRKVGTVKSDVHRGLERLRTIVETERNGAR